MRTTFVLCAFAIAFGAAVGSTDVPAIGQEVPQDSRSTDAPTSTDVSIQNQPAGRDDSPQNSDSLDRDPQTADDGATSENEANDPGWTTEWDENERLRIVDVDPDGLAAQLGLQSGDEILTINGRDIQSGDNVDQYLPVHTGQRLSMVILRDGERRTIHVFPETDRPTSAMLARRRGPPMETGLLLQGQEAVFITDVQRGSPADRAGLVPGDELLSVNGRRFYSSSDFARALRQFAAGDRVRIQVARNNRVHDVLIPLVAQSPASPPRNGQALSRGPGRRMPMQSRAYRPDMSSPPPRPDDSRMDGPLPGEVEPPAANVGSALQDMQQQLAALQNQVNALRAEVLMLRREIAEGGSGNVR